MVSELIKRMHFTRKGFGLFIMGVIWILIGIGIVDDVHRSGAWHQALPLPIRIGIWCGAGLVAIASAWVHNLRPWAMALLVIGPGIRFFSFLTSWIIYLLPEGNEGYQLGWLGALTNLVMILFVFYIAADDESKSTYTHVNEVLKRSGNDGTN